VISWWDVRFSLSFRNLLKIVGCIPAADRTGSVGLKPLVDTLCMKFVRAGQHPTIFKRFLNERENLTSHQEITSQKISQPRQFEITSHNLVSSAYANSCAWMASASGVFWMFIIVLYWLFLKLKNSCFPLDFIRAILGCDLILCRYFVYFTC
jgi:hypothetical protein